MTSSGRYRKFFNKAKALSHKSTHPKAQIGAIIVSGNQIVGEGFSQYKTHTRQSQYDKKMSYHGTKGHLHAEIAALVSSGRANLKGAEIFVYRKDKNGHLANCRPCVSCSQALLDAGVRHVYYTDREGYNYEQI